MMRRVPFIIAAGLLACSVQAHAQDDEGQFEPAMPLPPPPPSNDGGIFQPSAGYVGLYEGTRAHKVGDLVALAYQLRVLYDCVCVLMTSTC